MLTYQLATPDQYEELFQLLEAEASDYLGDTLRLMEMDRSQFFHLFSTVGQIYTINQDNHLAGFYWIEERGKGLHLHGLILKPSFQGRGVGREVLQMLIDRYKGQMDFIELGVHQSNKRAQDLYRRLGFEAVRRLEDLGYIIMQRNLGDRLTVDGTH